mmetsp:Transcript_18697/g.29145  ORF Transcript_18697/g.29145 Transcript_18697/m.29145 type:complete len:229 (+) Transcript_18697:1026-1712(+)
MDECLSTKILKSRDHNTRSTTKPSNRPGQTNNTGPYTYALAGTTLLKDFEVDSNIHKTGVPSLTPPPAFEMEQQRAVGIGPKQLLAIALKRCKEYGVDMSSYPATPSSAPLSRGTKRLIPLTPQLVKPQQLGFGAGLRASYPPALRPTASPTVQTLRISTPGTPGNRDDTSPLYTPTAQSPGNQRGESKARMLSEKGRPDSPLGFAPEGLQGPSLELEKILEKYQDSS